MSSSKKDLPWTTSLLAGGSAGAFEAFCTYPFEFAKTRVQLRTEKGSPTPKNPLRVIAQVYRAEGLAALYRGCSTLVVGSVGKDGVRFLTFDAIKNRFKNRETNSLSPLGNLGAGMVSGVLASFTFVTPTERIKTALIDDARGEKRFRGAWHCVRTVYGESGVRGLYNGLEGTTMKQAGATAVRMGSYNILKDLERAKGGEPEDGILKSFGNGAIAGTVTTLTTQPFDTVKTRCQSARGETALSAIRGVLVDYGIRGFWKGTTMRLGRTVVSGGILFMGYEWAVKILDPVLGR
ncbi:tricarboxylate transport protein-like protein [Piedraia hortae CBS 480.64]|uniref:Tricarboxylate transport protein-like protein n=1 Tax=Piedraia hortae CBS 480.64 TaxID=1314780 RepID=A0A6A7C023_9PEZI|nr:tricarboxylate transport protein-like protein [Piedraia hortae CBS 480.64]